MADEDDGSGLSDLGDDDDGRSILDEQGRLFGLVNVVDLLVVLLVLAVVAAGAALLLGESGQQDTRYATIDLGTQPAYVAEQISPGDEFEPQGTGNSITVTDVYRFEQNGAVHVIVRAAVNGTLIEPDDPDDEPTFQFRGSALRAGQSVTIQTPEYSVEGAVTRLQRSGETLPVQDSSFVIETVIPAGTAEEVGVGDQFTVANETVAEVAAVSQFPGASGDERLVLLGISAQTIERGGTVQYAGNPVRIGSTVPFQSDGYQLSGEIVERGSSMVETDSRPFVIETTVPAAVADDIDSGDEFRFDGEPIASVESVTVYTGETADVRNVILGVSVRTREDDGTILFGERPIRIGSTIPIETPEYDISGEIIRRNSLEEPGEPATRTVTVSLDNVRPERAAVIEDGDAERTSGQTVAEVRSKATEPAEIILESESGEIFLREHPRNLDVDLEVQLSVRELEDGTVRFRGEQLRAGETLTLDFGTLRIQGEVRNIEN